MKKIIYLIEYTFVWLLDTIICALPRRMALAFGEFLGRLLGIVLSGRQRLMEANLKQAFPDMSAAHIRRISTVVWENMGRIVVEFVRLPEILASSINLSGASNAEKALAAGRGVVFITPHFTNWELTGAVVRLFTRNMVAIARPMKNPFVEKWIQSKRQSGGMEIIPHRQAVKASLKALKANKTVGILVDQNLYTGGIFVDFFGRPAATTTLPALLNERTGAPIVFTYALRSGSRFIVTFDAPLTIPLDLEGDERIRFITRALNEKLENLVRRYPENWFWIHNRWKRQPGSTAE